MVNEVVDFRNVYKTYKSYKKRVEALKGISFEIHEGDLFGIIGPNGAGKTTILSMIATVSAPTIGVVRVFGRKIDEKGIEIRRKIGVMFQESLMDYNLKVIDNFKIFAKLKKVKKEESNERIAYFLKELGLENKRDELVRNLSGGSIRKLYLGLCLLNRPELIVLDEPTTGLDPAFRLKFLDYIKHLNGDERKTVVVSTHYMEEAEICSDIIVVNKGKIIARGSPERLKRSVGKDIVKFKVDENEANEVLLNQLVQSLRESYDFEVFSNVDNGEISVNIKSNSSREMFDNVKKFSEFMLKNKKYDKFIKSIEIKRVDLNDVFLYYTNKRSK